MTYIKKMFVQGKHSIYTPINIEKYKGKGDIICRSSYEVKFCRWLDVNENVLEWSSESVEIEYYDLVKMKKRRYYPDFYMKAKDKDGKIKKYIIEIKPSKETKPPRLAGRKKKDTLLNEQKVWETNQAKWKAALNWCNKWGFEFKLITEKQLFK